MATFIYLPVSTPEMQQLVKDWNDGRAAQNKAPYQVIANNTSGNAKALRRTFGTGFLEQVAAGDKLYVLTHGIASPTSGGALVIGNKRGGTLKDNFIGGLQTIGGVHKLYTDATFARHLEEEGLTKAFVDLRLFCCCAGLPATHQGNVLAPYASRLRNALHNRNYLQITVTGYLGDVGVHGHYFKPGTSYMDNESLLGMGPNVRVQGEQVPVYFKEHAVTF